MKFYEPFSVMVVGSYQQAKLMMVRLWTPITRPLPWKFRLMPICAACLKPINLAPAAHHAILSQRYEWARCALWNLAPVHQSPEGDCHDRLAHGAYRDIVIQRLYWIVGNGDPEAGKQIIVNCLTREMTCPPGLPEIRKEGLWQRETAIN